MVSDDFWAKLSTPISKLMRDVWARRTSSATATMSAKSQAERARPWQANGVTFVDPSPEQVAAERKRMMAAQADLDPDAKLSPEIVKFVEEAVGSHS